MQLKSVGNSPWEMSDGADATLRIGQQHLPVRDISSVVIVANGERDFLASLLNYAAALCVASVFMVLVVQAGWRERFLLVTVFLALVSLTSLMDIVQSTRITLFRLRITTVDGRAVDFVSANATEVDRLAARLRRAGKA